MPNMEQLICKKSAKITKCDGETWMSKIELDCAYGQAELSMEASKHCVFSISRDNTGSKRVFTVYQTSTQCSNNI